MYKIIISIANRDKSFIKIPYVTQMSVPIINMKLNNPKALFKGFDLFFK